MEMKEGTGYQTAYLFNGINRNILGSIIIRAFPRIRQNNYFRG